MATDFSGQQTGEEVQFIIRRHRSAMNRDIIGATLIIAISFVPLVMSSLGKLSGQWVWYSPLTGILLGGYLIFNGWLKWYYSIYIVTNLRIRRQTQRSLFKKSSIDVYLNKVQNISYNMSGLFSSVMDYGTIVLQTMAGDLVMTRIPNCEEVYSQLSSIVRMTGGQSEQGNDYDQ